MIHGFSFLSAFGKVFLGNEDWQDALMDLLTGGERAILGALAPTAGVLTPIPYEVDTWSGTTKMVLPAGTYRLIAADRYAEFTEAAEGVSDVPYTGLGHYLSMTLAEYPTLVATDVNGVRGFKRYKTALGEQHVPSAVTVNGDGLDLALTSTPVFSDVTLTRPAIAWKVNPVTASAEAIYTGVLEVVSGALKVRVTHAFGQTSPSLTASDYIVFLPGLTVSAAEKSPTTHALLGRSTPNDAPALTCWTGSQDVLNPLSSSLVRAGSLRLDVIKTALADDSKRWKMTLTPEGSSLYVVDLVARAFNYHAEPAVTAASRFFGFHKEVTGGGSNGLTSFRLYPLDATADTDADAVHLALGGNGDLGLVASKVTVNGKTDHGITFVRNGTPVAAPAFAILAADGGTQEDETETGKKAVLVVPDLAFSGANGKKSWRLLPLTSGRPHQASGADVGDWFLGDGGTTEPVWQPIATGGSERFMFLSVGGPRGRKVLKVRAYCAVTGVGGKVRMSAWRWTSSGPVAVTGGTLLWETGSDGWKECTFTAPEELAADTDLFLKFYVSNGEDPDAGCGLHMVQVQESFFNLD